MLGLPGHDSKMTDYNEIKSAIGKHVQQFTTQELERMNAAKNQAGVPCLKPEEFIRTEQGKALLAEPPLRVTKVSSSTPPIAFPLSQPSSPSSSPSSAPRPQILTGVKVLELCRIIAGPSIGKGLAEYGASVLKITSPHLSDVPFFQVDVNSGKACAELDLKTKKGRKAFETLLLDADVVLDGYRPGALTRLGYGPEQLVQLAESRGRGIVYVQENCFGNVGPWKSRPGWQQIADCATGIAWQQGWWMGLNEPVVPPFPMSDYGTGCMGTIAALVGLYRRAKEGGSYLGAVSLCQYDLFLQSLGLYPDCMQHKLREHHDKHFFGLRHDDSVDEVGKRAMESMRKLDADVLRPQHTGEVYSEGFGAKIKFVKPVVGIEGTWNGWIRAPRPNGFDEPRWDDWETDVKMIKACE
jgi:hypothetical protein